MKGIILAGGHGTRLYPLTIATSKQLLPIYDKPMIYYPLSVLMLAGIKEVLFITTPQDKSRYESLFGNGKNLGLDFQYLEQSEPLGLAHPFLIAGEFIGNDSVCMILGDNIFYGDNFSELLRKTKNVVENENKTVIFGYPVKNPQEFGVASFDKENNIIDIEEKPRKPKSNMAIIGLYFFPNDVTKKARKLLPSQRGELEITDLNKIYLNEKRLKIQLLGRGFTWLDTGSHETLFEANQFVYSIERNKTLKIGCIEEIAFKNNWISEKQLKSIVRKIKNESYKKYLLKLIEV